MLKGTKKVEIPYFLDQLEVDKSILIIGECVGVDGISKGILEKGCTNVTTTDIRATPPDSWLAQNTNWTHRQTDFLEFDETYKFDFLISVSVFEHFGLYWDNMNMHGSGKESDVIRWNHDIKAFEKCCRLLKDKDSKLIVTLPAGPFFNYNENGEPILRYYDKQRQSIVKRAIEKSGCYLSDEKFYFSSNFEDWQETTSDVNNVEFYPYYNMYTPNVIWAFTVQQA